MFNYGRIGTKIKGLSKISFIAGAIATIILGTALLVIGIDGGVSALILLGLFIIVCGPIIAWVSSWLLYGFGEIVDKICDIELNTRINENKQKDSSKKIPEKKNKNTPTKSNNKQIISGNIVFNEINDNAWVCPECCRENSNDITECKCGYQK